MGNTVRDLAGRWSLAFYVGTLFHSDAMREQFRFQGARKLFEITNRVNEFRNTRIAHQEKELTDAALAKRELLS